MGELNTARDEAFERITTLVDRALDAALADNYTLAFLMTSVALRCALIELHR